MDSSYSFPLLVQAFEDCMRRKRNTASAMRFDMHRARNLVELDGRLRDGSYRPGRSVCFAVTDPKPREIWAADFTDRIVHHLLHNYVAPIFLPRFTADTCACIRGRGPLYAAERLEGHVRSCTQNWTISSRYIKADLANFFNSIHKLTLWSKLAPYIREGWWRDLAHVVLFHDPRTNYVIRGNRANFQHVPPHKRLTYAPDGYGLPIGNLMPSQFGANVLLDSLDKFVKHTLRARYYIRYVDDFVLLHPSAAWLNDALKAIEGFLPGLKLELNPSKTVRQPIERGIDFIGQVVKPWHREPRRRIVRKALTRIERAAPADLWKTGNSYLGLIQHSASRNDRADICNALRKRGLTVSANFDKAYRPREAA